MSANFPEAENIGFVDGELVDSADLLTEAAAARNRTQEVLAAILGTANMLPAYNPLQISTDGSFQLTVGGANQWVYVEGTWCDWCPATQLQCPGSGPVQRIDSIAIKAVPLQADGDTISREVEAIDGSKNTQSIPENANTIALQYVQGSEAPPAGYVEFARVTVPANASGLNAADIQIVFPDPRKAITGTDATPVTTINGDGGDVTLVGKGNVNVVPSASTPGEIDITGTPTTINGASGAVTLEGDGQITVTPDGANKFKINAPPAQVETSVMGLTGAITMSGTGIAAVTKAGQNINVNVPAPPAAATINGDGPQAFKLQDGNGVHVRRASTGVFAFDNEGVTHVNGTAGDIALTSSDGTVSINPSGSTIDLKTVQKVLPVGGVLKAAGTGSLTLDLPAGEFLIEYIAVIDAGGNFFTAAVQHTEGNVTTLHTVNATTSQNAAATLVYACTAAGNQTVGFGLTGISGSFGGDSYACITATKISD